MPYSTTSWIAAAEAGQWSRVATAVRPAEMERIKQDIDAYTGVNEVTTDSRSISMLVTIIRAGESSNAHYHLDHESALYCVSGHAHVFFGDELEFDVQVRAGDFLYIPPFCPHKTYSQSHDEDAVFVTARTDALEQERVVPVPQIDDGRCDQRLVWID